MVINYNNIGGDNGGSGGGGGGTSTNIVNTDGVMFIDGVPAPANPYLTRWMVDNDPERIDNSAFNGDPDTSMYGYFLQWKYYGYNIGDTIQTPAYLPMLTNMTTLGSVVRLINNDDDSVEIVFFSWGGGIFYNTNGDMEDLGGDNPIIIPYGETHTFTGANGVEFVIEHFSQDTSEDTDDYKKSQFRINSITGGSVRVDNRSDNERFQTVIVRTQGEPNSPDSIKYNGRKSMYYHPYEAD